MSSFLYIWYDIISAIMIEHTFINILNQLDNVYQLLVGPIKLTR